MIWHYQWAYWYIMSFKHNSIEMIQSFCVFVIFKTFSVKWLDLEYLEIQSDKHTMFILTIWYTNRCSFQQCDRQIGVFFNNLIYKFTRFKHFSVTIITFYRRLLVCSMTFVLASIVMACFLSLFHLWGSLHKSLTSTSKKEPAVISLNVSQYGQSLIAEM